MDAVVEYSKVPDTIQSYDKAQSYAKLAATPSEPKETRQTRRCDAVSSTASSAS